MMSPQIRIRLHLLSFALAAIALPAVGRAPAVQAPGPGGKEVFDSSCAACHGAGVAGAPELYDKAALAARSAAGKAALQASAITGKGVMPPRGGNAGLSDAEVIAAVEYMISHAK